MFSSDIVQHSSSHICVSVLRPKIMFMTEDEVNHNHHVDTEHLKQYNSRDKRISIFW